MKIFIVEVIVLLMLGWTMGSHVVLICNIRKSESVVNSIVTTIWIFNVVFLSIIGMAILS
ncbi:hypothetical protein PB01_08170 [Psychrobacillus glaciei]|uniref:Uncharacterized protein n=1 Tax=Psychrobacillus glaciei TaxID=2283160 RepID=A0A5J6SLE5_9BACI|nr:hypothetical protein [Psychrobacillus glaciei]QFF98810.1 hypothetical protein PB01_08170 [Psychrobacillus glaciei]